MSTTIDKKYKKMDYKPDWSLNQISETVSNWTKIFIQIFHKELKSKFTEVKSETGVYSKYTADFTLIHSAYGDKKYLEENLHKKDFLVPLLDKWSIKVSMFGLHNVDEYPLEIVAKMDNDNKDGKLLVNIKFNSKDWKSILNNEQFLQELEEALIYELTRFIHRISLKQQKRTSDISYQIGIVKDFLMNRVDSEHYETIYFLASVGLCQKPEVNARIHQFLAQGRRFDFADSTLFEQFWNESTHKKIYDALKDFKADEVFEAINKAQGEGYLAEIITDWYNFTKSNEELELARIPEKYITNPLSFLKYWEKIFHKTAFLYKRKCLQVYPLINYLNLVDDERQKERDKAPKTTYHYGYGSHD